MYLCINSGCICTNTLSVHNQTSIDYGPRAHCTLKLERYLLRIFHYCFRDKMSFNLKLGNDFLRVPRLPADSKGFIVWKERLELSVCAHRLYGHLDGTVTKPDKPDEKLIESPVTVAVKPEVGPAREGQGSTSKELTTEQVSLIEKYTKDLNQYLQEQAIVFQQIASTIPDFLYLKIKGKPTMKEAWDALKADFE